MDHLWALPEGSSATVREVHAALAADRDIAYTTVMTVLDRLAGKDVVTQQREGRAFRYAPRASRAAMAAELMRGTLADFTADDRDTALVAFVEQASAADLAALREALQSRDPRDDRKA